MKQSKFVFLLCALILAGLAVSSLNCMFPSTMSGQVGVNIYDQPVWGPEGYDYAEYYYIPDIDSYYSVSEHQYIYRDGSTWRHSPTLPNTYNGYDPYHSYKVVINGSAPYENDEINQSKYRTYKGKRDQRMIRDSHDPKYFEIKDHPQHNQWEKEHQRH
ncbi:MAG: hypothetical protein EHM64_04595 [Ignavibacteriae bacterium]|nr:MAG: hypothetical protein EHM64_04595 [Ignavibacteriota bacterium]